MLPVYCIVLTIAAVHHEKIDRKKEWGNLLILAAIFLLYLYIRWWYIHEIAGPYEAAAFFEGDLALLFRSIFS